MLPDLDQLQDTQLASALRERLEGSGVEPKVKTDVRRTQRRLKTARGDIVDAAFDAVVFSNLRSQTRAIGHELELELEKEEVEPVRGRAPARCQPPA
ncbi:MAG: hypothetical protein U1E87_05335 [Alphaproteobacteria bacterium]